MPIPQSGPSIADLTENFALFDDWEDRYRYVIELGQGLEPFDPALKTDDNLVRGCTSRVWLAGAKNKDAWHFTADSDAHIVRGLIAIALSVYQDKTPDEIAATDIAPAFARLGLSDHLSPSRRNGFFRDDRKDQAAG